MNYLEGGSASLSVTVLDEQSGQTLPWASIYLRRALTGSREPSSALSEFVALGKTDRGGQLTIKEMHPGIYLIDVVLPGYVRLTAALLGRAATKEDVFGSGIYAWLTDAIWHLDLSRSHEAEAARVEVHDSAQSHVTLRISPGRVLRGRVVGGNGVGIQDVRVAIRDEFAYDTRIPSFPSVYSSSSGDFEITVHPAATFTLASDNGDFQFDEYYGSPADRRRFILVQLKDGSTLSGVTINTLDSPERSAVIALQPCQGGKGIRITTDDLGVFRIPHLDRGPIVLLACNERSVGLVRLPEPVAGQISIPLSLARSVAGRVFDASGLPMPGRLVQQILLVRSDQYWLDFSLPARKSLTVLNPMTSPVHLRVDLDISFPSAVTDNEGWFSLEGFVPEGDQIHLRILDDADPKGGASWYDTWVSIGTDLELVFVGTQYATYPEMTITEH